MNMKDHILAALREQFDHWEELLASLSEQQLTAPHFDFDWSLVHQRCDGAFMWLATDFHRTDGRRYAQPGT